MRRLILLAALGLGVLLGAACADVSGPRVATSTPLAALRSGEIGEIHHLTQSPLAPPLETYELRFWVVGGRKKTVAVNYLPDAGGQVFRFMRLHFPAGAQLTRPDGTPVAVGDSVLIEGWIDRVLLVWHFEPHGLAFGGSKPSTLRLYYGLADLNVIGDDEDDEDDDEGIEQILAMFHQDSDIGLWTLLSDQNTSLSGRYIEATLAHFSHFAISW